MNRKKLICKSFQMLRSVIQI